jgi:hypothetical protein
MAVALSLQKGPLSAMPLRGVSHYRYSPGIRAVQRSDDMATLDRASARQRLAPRGVFPRTITICDGLGGSLGLDLDCRELEALAFACHCLLDDMAPPGASLIKVTAGNHVYLVSRPKAQGEQIHLQITSLYEPEEHIQLTPDMAALVIALVEQGLVSRHGQIALPQD